MANTCRVNSDYLMKTKICLDPLSKDVKGELRPLDVRIEKCEERRCKTLKADQVLRLEVFSHDPCDKAKFLDGALFSRNLAHAYVDADGNKRGVHAGDFIWNASGFQVVGTLSGITNAGTHRKPVFDPCQECYAPGFMEGQLCGEIVESEKPELLGCQVFGDYRLRFDPASSGGEGAVEGTLEGLVICPCRPQAASRRCIDFTSFPLGPGPNPRLEQGVQFHVFDFAGVPTPTSDIANFGAFTGLNVNFETRIGLPVTASLVEATLVSFASPATMEAFNSDGTSAGTVTMSVPQGTPETLSISGKSISRVFIKAPQDETLLLKFCYQPL